MMLAYVGGEPVASVEDPTVAGHVALSAAEYRTALRQGGRTIDGIFHRVHEGYTMSAFLLAQLDDLL